MKNELRIDKILEIILALFLIYKGQVLLGAILLVLGLTTFTIKV